MSAKSGKEWRLRNPERLKLQTIRYRQRLKEIGNVPLDPIVLREKVLSHCIPEPNTGCWLWTGILHHQYGYGALKMKGRLHRANRLSYMAFRGDPTGMLVCHKCDTPACVNPDHLWLGTNKDNFRDSEAKKRRWFQKKRLVEIAANPSPRE